MVILTLRINALYRLLNKIEHLLRPGCRIPQMNAGGKVAKADLLLTVCGVRIFNHTPKPPKYRPTEATPYTLPAPAMQRKIHESSKLDKKRSGPRRLFG